MKIIDMHCSIGSGIETQQSIDELLPAMDRCRIERSVVSTVDQFRTVYNRAGNEAVLKAVRQHPDRLTGFAVVNPWFGKDGIAELERAVGQGLRGLALFTHQQGCFLTDNIVFDLVHAADTLRIPVYCHTGTPIFALPLGLMELALRFPDASFIMGSAGYADGWYDVIPAASHAENIYVETSYCPIQLIQTIIEEIGIERVLFGSDAPGNSQSSELLKFEELELSPEERNHVFYENALRLLATRD
jgi:predicted TIM-barrel fold metal-dependent hydrolase